MDLFSAEVAEACAVCGVSYPRPAEVACPVCTPPGEPGRCRSPACRAPVRWLLTDAGAWMPVDVGPAEGNLVLEHTLGGWRVHTLLRGEVPPGAPEGVTWRPHWASCPDADTWRTG